MELRFAFPLAALHWWLIPTIVVMAGVILGLRFLEKRRAGRLHRFVTAKLAPRLLVGFDASVRRPLFWMTVLGVASLAVALAQPHWGQAWKEVRKQSRDVLICLDTSESMRATDFLPNRLERAKQKLLTLLDRSPGDRFGLIAFSGASAMQCPLTLDHGYFKAVLNAVDTDSISQEGTDIAAALDEAVEVFREEDASGDTFSRDTRAILLISDGEQVSGDAVARAEEASQYCRVYVFGVGDPGGAEVRIPDQMTRNKTGPRGAAMHHSKLDEETLIKLAKAGNGPYIAASMDDWDVDQAYAAMERLESRAVESDLRLQLVNRFQWPLAFAIILFAGEGAWLALLPWLRAWRGTRREGVEHG